MYAHIEQNGSFFEVSLKAGSYRVELLGLLAIHILVSAIEQYLELGSSMATIACNSKGAMFKSKEYIRHIPNGASQADIKQILHNVKTKLHDSFIVDGSSHTRTTISFGTNSPSSSNSTALVTL